MTTDSKNLPDAWLIELGKMTQAWATFEQFLNLMIQKLANFDDPFDPTFTILVAHASMPQRLDMFASLCFENVDKYPHLQEYKSVIGQIKEAQTARNRFSHNIIDVDHATPGQGKMGVVSSRGKLKQELQDVTLSELRQAVVKIEGAMQSIYQLVLNTKI